MSIIQINDQRRKKHAEGNWNKTNVQSIEQEDRT